EAQLSTAFEAWRQDWADIDNEGYLSHYAEHFSDLRRNKAEWSAYKVMVNNAKSFIQVKTSNISFIADPRDHNLVSVRFYQDYRSSNHDWTGWKEQLWQNTAQGWKIIYEGDGSCVRVERPCCHWGSARLHWRAVSIFPCVIRGMCRLQPRWLKSLPRFHRPPCSRSKKPCLPRRLLPPRYPLQRSAPLRSPQSLNPCRSQKSRCCPRSRL